MQVTQRPERAVRLRRLRRTDAIRELVRETRLHPHQFVYPMFVRGGRRVREPIPSMPGQFRLSVDELVSDVSAIRGLGIDAVLLFGLPDAKDPAGSGAYADDGIVREAAGSAPQFGDRRGYQMDPPNAREAEREVAVDLAEGADIVMVKPALPFLDVLSRIRRMVTAPLAAYNVSGEYAMVKAAAEHGWLDEPRAVLEVLTAIARAGADLIITYHAKEAAAWLRRR